MPVKLEVKEIEKLLQRPAISVTDCGMMIFGLSRNGSYDAAKRGDFETFNVGKKIMVPTAPLRRKLGMDPA
jgi:hypothetical protein